MDGQMYECMDQWMDGPMDGFINQLISGYRDRLMDDGLMNEWFGR